MWSSPNQTCSHPCEKTWNFDTHQIESLSTENMEFKQQTLKEHIFSIFPVEIVILFNKGRELPLETMTIFLSSSNFKAVPTK